MLRYRFHSSFCGLLLCLTCCGDNVSVKDASGNAMLVLDAKPGAAIDGTDLTLNEVRVWKSTPNDQGPGAYDMIDNYSVEVWATLKGETAGRYFRESGLLADAQGNLFQPSAAPGQIQYYDKADAAILDTPPSYTISTSDPFISLETSAGLVLTKIAVSGTTTTTTKAAVDPAQIPKTPWTDLKYREYTESMFTRVRREKNVGLATKGKMGCLSVTKGGDGGVDFGSYLFQDVELGNMLRFGSEVSYKDTSAKGAEATDKSGADNYLVMEWQEAWYLTGLNVTTKRIRMVRERWVPFYQVRELPTVDRSTTTPQPAGIESLVRSCNAAASGGAFRLVFLSPSAFKKSATLTIADDNTYCANLKAAAEGAAVEISSIPMNTTNYSGNYSTSGTDSAALGCNFTNITVGAGSWTGGPTAGQYHDGNVTPAGGDTYYHFEQSAIVDTAL